MALEAQQNEVPAFVERQAPLESHSSARETIALSRTKVRVRQRKGERKKVRTQTLAIHRDSGFSVSRPVPVAQSQPENLALTDH